MFKKILIGLGVIIVLLIIAVIYLNHRNRTLSPAGRAEYSNNEFMIEVEYSRPSVRGRVIFGTEEEGALQPYGVYWRMGANESTEMTFHTDVNIAGNELSKGRYKVYAVPGPESFEIYFNSELGNWGYSEADHDKDLFHFPAEVHKADPPVEQFTIRFEEEGDTVLIVSEFGDVEFMIPVTQSNP